MLNLDRTPAHDYADLLAGDEDDLLTIVSCVPYSVLVSLVKDALTSLPSHCSETSSTHRHPYRRHHQHQ